MGEIQSGARGNGVPRSRPFTAICKIRLRFQKELNIGFGLGSVGSVQSG